MYNEIPQSYTEGSNFNHLQNFIDLPALIGIQKKKKKDDILSYSLQVLTVS